MDDARRVRIGELSRRTGVAVDTLRAWERRYGVFDPDRTAGGFRLYGERDLVRARAMKSLIDDGLSAAEAARAVSSDASVAVGGPTLAGASMAGQLAGALARLDEAGATELLDRAIASFATEALLREVVLPAIREIGVGWGRGEVGVAEEHFATNLLRGRLLALGRGWGSGSGPLAILACPPAELHDLGLIAFGLVLHGRGWRIAYLGQDTPLETIGALAERLGRPPVILAALDGDRFDAVREQLRSLSGHTRLLGIGGEGQRPELAAAVGAMPLDGDPVEAAITLSAAG